MSTQLLVIVLAAGYAVARKWADMLAEYTARRAGRWFVDTAAPRLARVLLLAAEHIASADSEVSADVTSLLAEHSAYQRSTERAPDERSPLSVCWSLRLLARAAGRRVAAVGGIVNATIGNVAFGFATAWAVLWFQGGVCVEMKTGSGYTAAAWIYSVPLGLLTASGMVMLVTSVIAYSGLKRRCRNSWRPAMVVPRSLREGGRRLLQLGAGVAAVSLIQVVVMYPCSMRAYGLLGLVLAAVCRRHLGLRLACLSVVVGAVAGGVGLLLLEAGQEIAAWIVLVLMPVPIARLCRQPIAKAGTAHGAVIA
jgi:hypothetical protein